MSSQDLPQIRRILIAIDASPSSLAALRAAIRLAGQLGAELTGVFVEDVNLLRLADLALAREVTFYSASFNTLDRTQVERQLRAQANEARKALVRLAEREHVRTQFQVARGLIASELLQAAGDADVVILGKVGWSRRKQLGSTTLVMVTQSGRSVLVVQQGRVLEPPITVAYDGSEVADNALRFASQLALEEHSGLAVIVYAKSIEEARQLQHEVSRALRPRRIDLRFRWLLGPDASKLRTLARSMEIGLLILPALPGLDSEQIATLLNDLDVPIYIFR